MWCVVWKTFKLRRVVKKTETIDIVKFTIAVTSLFHFEIVTHIVNRYDYIIHCSQYTTLYTRFLSQPVSSCVPKLSVLCSQTKCVMLQNEWKSAEKIIFDDFVHSYMVTLLLLKVTSNPMCQNKYYQHVVSD